VAGATQAVTVSACPTAAMNFTENVAFSCAPSPLACTEGAFPQPTPNSNRNAAGATVGKNSFLSIAILGDSMGSPARTRRMSLPADTSAYDTGRLTFSDLVDVSGVTATTTSVTGTTATRTSAGWAVVYPTIDEKTVTSSTVLGGCVIWSSLIPSGGAVGCASAGTTIAPFYQSDAFSGAPNCAASFLSGTTYARAIQRNVISPPPEPAAAVSLYIPPVPPQPPWKPPRMGVGGSTQLRLSTLEIQPGAQEVTQMTVGTSSEMLQMLYSIPLTVDQHTCRHVDPASCP